MPPLENRLTLGLTQANHLVFHHNAVAGKLLDVVSRIAPTRRRTQVDHKGKHRQPIAFDEVPDIARHAAIHRLLRAIGGLKLAVNQRFLPSDTHANQAIGAADFHGGLLGLEHLEHLDATVSECEVEDVLRVGLNDVFG